MKINPDAEIFIPNGAGADEALSQTTHLGIGAHQDDLEILALHGVLQGLKSNNSFFSGITCTDGAGSPRAGKFADVSDAEMKEIRLEEQRQAASKGEYSAMIQLKHPSSVVKDPASTTLADELESILLAACPSVVYTHNLADKHSTHVAVSTAVIEAMRRLPDDRRPKQLYGVEVWRTLDWLPDEKKVLLDLSGAEELALSLIGLYESQIAGGKRYDEATVGRWRANATYFESHGTDMYTLVAYAMDLSPLVLNKNLSVTSFMSSLLDEFRQDVLDTLAVHAGRTNDTPIQ